VHEIYANARNLYENCFIPSHHSRSHTLAIIKHARAVVLCLSQKLLIPHVVRCPIFYLPLLCSLVPVPESYSLDRLLSRRQSPAVCFMQILPLCATMLLKNDNKPSIEQKKWLPGGSFPLKRDYEVPYNLYCNRIK